MTSPESSLTWVAARTNTIRTGRGVVCVPSESDRPVRAAGRAMRITGSGRREGERGIPAFRRV